ncbi:MAG: SDR family NAD(P)-dependent oxidoreductase [Candidatus Cloacimonetes bacterium]|nr:SDR family NAD(P)-dependent oxidoreductase [Candidatus Cloacimonadota bacterium]
MMKCLSEQRTIIITGASGSIASGLISRFIELGDKLILIYRVFTEEYNSIKKKYPEQIFGIESDLKNLSEIQNKLDNTIADNKLNPGFLIHTAAMRSIDFSSLADGEPQIWYDVIENNLIITYHILRCSIEILRRNGFGRIVLFGSNVSRIGLGNGSAYSASKAAIANLCRSVACEEAENNILINTISPGPVKIDDSKFNPEYREFRKQYYDDQLKRIPLNRLADVDDIFNLCNFLISKTNTYITGEEIFVTGGAL